MLCPHRLIDSSHLVSFLAAAHHLPGCRYASTGPVCDNPATLKQFAIDVGLVVVFLQEKPHLVTFVRHGNRETAIRCHASLAPAILAAKKLEGKGVVNLKLLPGYVYPR